MRISTSLIYQRGVDAINQQQSLLSKTEQQLATGERLRSPADDPFAATRINTLDDQTAKLDQYVRNSGFAKSRLELEESALTSSINALQRLRELAIQMANGTYSAEDRIAVSYEAVQLRDALFQYANSVDEDGEYIFSGHRIQQPAFQADGNGNYDYQGDQGQRFIQIGTTRTVPTGDSGYDVFENIQVAGSYTTDNLSSLNFTGGQTLAFDVDGFGVSLTGNDYTNNMAGLIVDLQSQLDALDGGNANGQYRAIAVDEDTFRIEAVNAGAANNTYQAQLDNFVTTVSGADNGRQVVAGERNVIEIAADFAANLAAGLKDENAIATISSAIDRLSSFRSAIGGRINTIDSEVNANGTVGLVIDKNRSDLKDLDYAEAISRFQQQLAGLQAAQQSFVQIQGLSLFNYI